MKVGWCKCWRWGDEGVEVRVGLCGGEVEYVEVESVSVKVLVSVEVTTWGV